ncbi:PREDICTED: ADP-ribosylation factor-like protein 13B [Papilio polytes]|uniref:ADP-ribosylation factor-like protein 13B n=1 Tax=Papilio polytes TaxID=76194 RepID=UPI0006767805|nr:PREDICTED: ADP-ribosylation factor-like protein 13B [Papilio polytes]
MGNCWAIFRRRRLRRHIVLILIGLDNAGKTKTVNNLAGEKDDKVLPTVGFKAVNLIHKDTPVTIYDLGGGPQFRQIWSQYYSEVHGIIFVIDSSDFQRLEECKAVLEEVLSHDRISGKPVLVLANKQDKDGALDDIDVVEKLNIEPLVNKYRCPTLVESYTAYLTDTKSNKPKIDPGLRKGYHWLLNYIVRRYGDINLRVQTDIHADLERRKRLLNRAANRTSQTFTAESDDVATQTGFENPNFDPHNTVDREKDLERGVIVVKPIGVKPNSLDTTITIESVEDTDTSGKPKLSPLFGRSNSTVNEAVRIELEPRNEFRKLSPIVRKNAGSQPFDFKNRPHSSPTTKKIKDSQSTVSNSFIQEDDVKEDLDPKFSGGSKTWDAGLKHRVFVKDVELSQMHREIVLTEREGQVKTASSDIVTAATLPLSARPASASQLVRKQLEICAQQKRRLSLRYMQRNKTSPERMAAMLYEPKSQRHLDKGDFQQPTIIN